MYADRHHRSPALDSRSLGIAVAINAGVVAALLLSQPVLTIIKPRPPIHLIDVKLQPPPPELPPPPKPPLPRVEHQAIATPRPPIETVTALPPLTTTEIIPPAPQPTADPGSEVGPAPTPTPVLATIGPAIDPAHRGDLQPAYPAAELRAEREGVVVVRVLVGVDGRVRQVEPVSATSDAFFRATEERALARWRFRPATRGGVPVEAWRSMTIRFVIPR